VSVTAVIKVYHHYISFYSSNMMISSRFSGARVAAALAFVLDNENDHILAL